MTLSNERIQELKKIMEEESGKEVSLQEATEAGRNLVGFANLLFDLWVKEKEQERKLKESPKGFRVDGGYTCPICSHGTHTDGGWYDKWGTKCLICQASIDRGEIPGWVAKHRESWYSKYDLESRFNLKAPILRRWVKDGIIKPRIVMHEGKSRVQIFLLLDNRDFLPPKRLTESQLVKETKDGKDWYHSEPWYRFVDPFKHLKDYKIMGHMVPSTQ